jgi:hypothetical protein
MRFTKAVPGLGMAAALSLSSLVFSPSPATGEDFPTKPITVYCGFVAGATTDLTTRGLAAGAEKLLGVPVMVENKPGGSATVCAALIGRKKPDGYTLAVVDSGAISTTPLQLNVAYNPKKDFTLIMQYSRYVAGLCVLSESPLKTIDEFIAYAKAHPGLTYGSSGLYTQQQTGIELFALCKGLKFKQCLTGGARRRSPPFWASIRISSAEPGRISLMSARGLPGCSSFTRRKSVTPTSPTFPPSENWAVKTSSRRASSWSGRRASPTPL